MRVTFFPGSVVGYLDHPQALLTRGLAYGLAARGNDIRIVEERQNAIVKRTLLEVGAAPSRHFHDNFSEMQYHTYEPRTGAQLLEWVTREMALIDVAVAVDGVEQELCRWIGNVTRERLIRAFMTFDPAGLTDERSQTLELDKYDLIIAPSKPASDLPWTQLPPALAPPDTVPAIRSVIPRELADTHVDPAVAATAFEQIMTIMRR